jgi:hypothetical protein
MTYIKSMDEQALRKIVLSQSEAIIRLINQLEAQETVSDIQRDALKAKEGWKSHEVYVSRIAELEEAIREFLQIEGTKDYSSGYDVMYDMGISLLKKTIGKVPVSEHEK